jgi:hypothetical protein
VRLAVLTSNQPRHLALVERLAAVDPRLHAVVEATAPTGTIGSSSPVLSEYFARVDAAERACFGAVRHLPAGASVVAVRMGDLGSVPRSALEGMLAADRIVVFGSSWIRGWLVEELVARGAINIHMGISPQYRGSACNFWAVEDGNPHLVGATIHLLSAGLDSGPMLRHVRPRHEGEDSFGFTMKAVAAAHDALIGMLGAASLPDAVPQDRSLEVRYSRSADFTEDVAAAHLAADHGPRAIADALAAAPAVELLG